MRVRESQKSPNGPHCSNAVGPFHFIYRAQKAIIWLKWIA